MILSQTPTAIRLRAKRAGTFIPKTKEEISASHKAIAADRARLGWKTRKRPKPFPESEKMKGPNLKWMSPALKQNLHG